MTEPGKIRFFDAAGFDSVTAHLGDGSPVQTQGFGGWDEIERPRRKSLTVWKGRQPWRITVPVMFDRLTDGDFGASVEPGVRALEKLAGGGIQGEPPTMSVDTGGLMPHDFHDAPQVRWVIDGMEFGDTVRNPHGNRVRCEVTVTLLEYVDDVVVTDHSASKRASAKKSKGNGGKPGAKNKIHTVKKGETLSKIAKDELGDAARWREIGQLQKPVIRDPRSLKVGQKIRLP